jgi:serine/threonine protein kinase
VTELCRRRATKSITTEREVAHAERRLYHLDVGESDSPGFDARAQLPDQFGNYSILGLLATGGMAEVYLARQTGLAGFEKTVVIKRVRPELISDYVVTGYFLDEARLVATLQHPNIAQVYEIGVVNNSYFLVMEYVDGADLRQLMERAVDLGRQIPIADAIYILIQACVGLHYAHEKRGADGQRLDIIHRDVTPSNVLLSRDGGVKVCDFGIAKATTRTMETVRGALKGKYPYMSPEQCRAAPLDRRSDVFALGVLLYELSTLTRPFAADNDFEILRAIIELPVPPPSTRVVDYPPDLERIVMRALDKDPAGRYATAQAMQLDLEALAREHKFALSSVNVANLMAALFNDSVDTWVRAQREARTLADPILGPLVRASAPVIRPAADPPSPDSSHELDIETQPKLPALSANRVTEHARASRNSQPRPVDPAAPSQAAPYAPLATPAHSARVSGLAPTVSPLVPAASPLAPTVSPLAPTISPPLPDAVAPPVAFAPSPSADAYAARAFSPYLTGPGAEPFAPLVVPQTRRPSPLWLVGAVLAGLFAVSISFVGRLIDRAADDTAAATLDADAERLAAALDAGARAARLRADGIATAPLVRTAIETDAATMRDLSRSESTFSVAEGETLEILQTRNGKTTTLLRRPESGPATQPLAGTTTRVEASGKQVFVVAGAPIDGPSRITGSLAITSRIDLTAATRQLAEHAVEASLRGTNVDVPLIDPRDAPRGPARTIPLPTTGELAAAALTLVAVPLATPSTWIASARLAGIAAAALLLALYLIALLRSQRVTPVAR